MEIVQRRDEPDHLPSFQGGNEVVARIGEKR